MSQPLRPNSHTATVSLRETYGKTLVALGKQDKNIIVLDADLSPSTMTCFFAQEFPDRFFDCGLAEQNMISIAAGLAACGKTVFASTFAVFAACRCFDQVRICLSQTGLNVKVVATHGGITVGEDGLSHQAIEDLSLYCALPGFTVIVPADARETAEAVKAAASIRGPFYIRLSRIKSPIIYPEGYAFTVGKAITLREGKDVAIMATGIMVFKALEAAEALAGHGINCRVLDIHTIKPLDEETVVKAAAETGAIVVAEEHLAQGGLGSRVAQVLARTKPVPVEFINLGDKYALSGQAEELLREYSLTALDIERAAKIVAKRK